MEVGEIKAVVEKIEYKDLRLYVAPDASYLQVQNDSWTGRKWRLSLHMGKSEIVQTAFAACLAWEEHECREAFKYKGAAVFSPHYDVDVLVGLCQC